MALARRARRRGAAGAWRLGRRSAHADGGHGDCLRLGGGAACCGGPIRGAGVCPGGGMASMALVSQPVQDLAGSRVLAISARRLR
jgi:hypothetical protein